MISHVLVVDQGTTSTRAILFDRNTVPVAIEQREFPQHYPHPGWVEHDPEDLWTTTLAALRGVLQKSGLSAREIAALGIANQRETVLVWDRADGRPIHNAIVWQDRRTAEDCARLVREGVEDEVAPRTGLLIDPYFSATKIAWLLETIPGARARAERGELAFGTVDTFLLWRLTGGRVHATDETNASRTMLFNIHDGVWDEDLLRLFRIPRALLPDVRGSGDDFGATAAGLLGSEVPIRALVGDQQAGLIGQACFSPGLTKATYGTGAFLLLNTGGAAPRSRHRLLTTIVDPTVASATELALAYAKRWEIESVFDELKTHQRGPRMVLRSKSPELVEQEIWGHLCCHYAIRTMMYEAAAHGNKEPERISFISALRIARRSLAQQGAFSPSRP